MLRASSRRVRPVLLHSVSSQLASVAPRAAGAEVANEFTPPRGKIYHEALFKLLTFVEMIYLRWKIPRVHIRGREFEVISISPDAPALGRNRHKYVTSVFNKSSATANRGAASLARCLKTGLSHVTCRVRPQTA